MEIMSTRQTPKLLESKQVKSLVAKGAWTLEGE